MSRRAVSVLEILIVSLVSIVVLATLIGLWTGGSKMNKAAQSSVALQNALLLEETIYQDFHQLGINPSDWNTHLVSAPGANPCLSFYKTTFQGDQIVLRPVKYTRVSSPGGLWNLRRTEIGAGGKKTERTFGYAPLKDLKFGQIEDPVSKRRYLWVYLWVAEADRSTSWTAAANQDRPGCRTLIVRIPVPSHLGNPAMAPVTKIAPEPGTSLMPLDP